MTSSALGAELARYQAPAGKRAFMLALIGFAILFMLACAGGAVLTAKDMLRHDDVGSQAFAMFIGVLAVVALLFVRSFAKRFQRWWSHPLVVVYEHGLACDDIAMRWDGLKDVWIDIVDIRVRSGFATVASDREHRLTLSDASGQTIKLYESLPGTGRIADLARRAVFANMMPQAQADLAAGRSIAFGPHALGSDHLTLSGKEIPRSNIKRIEVANGLLIVHRRKGMRMSEWLRKIPNYDVLVALLTTGE